MRKDFSKIDFIEALVLTLSVAAVLLFIVWQLAYKKAAPETQKLQDRVGFLSGELESMNGRLKRIQARQVVSEKEVDVGIKGLRETFEFMKPYIEETAPQLV